jgi:murein DD-endopeptidase MepM/ murein hydrolase activator NlpD
MKRPHRERLRELFRLFTTALLLPLRRQIITAVALLFVIAAVLLSLDARLPFPPPSERILYDPTDWSLLFAPHGRTSPRQEKNASPALSVGGSSVLPPPLTIMLYTGKPGDTISGIATRLGLAVDTISTFNRPEGRGVHTVTVGEQLKIPNQDGIYLALKGDFDELCRKNKVAPEDVLAANSMMRDELAPGMQLFFPGVQHVGYALALQEGVGVALPLRGWETSMYGRRADPFTGRPSNHRGVDIAAPMGSPIRSATDGVVRAAGWDDTLGYYVEVRGHLGYSYVYGHMSQILVPVSTTVSTGKVIGLVGDTGYATGPHLHFEVRKNGVPQNPKYYLPGIR